MRFFKKLAIYIIIMLFFLSIYKDLTAPYPLHDHEPTEQKIPITSNVYDFQIVQVQMKHGKNTLSIIESLNPHLFDEWNIDKMLADFKKINPSIHPYELEPGKYYYFPLY